MALTVDEFASKIKEKYPDYASMDNQELVEKIVNKYPTYRSQVSGLTMPVATEEAGTELPSLGTAALGPVGVAAEKIADKAPGIAKEGLEILKSGFNKVKEGVTEEGSAFTEMPTLKEAALGPVLSTVKKLGESPEVVGGTADVIGGGLQTVGSPAAAIIQETPVVNTLFEKLGQGVEAASTFLGDKIGTTPEEKEALAKSFANLLDLGLMKTGTSKTGRGKLDAGLTKAKQAFDAPKVAVQNLNDSFLSKVTGLDSSTIKTLVDAPDQVKVMAEQGVEISRNNLFTDIKGKIDDVAEAKSTTGTFYDDLRNTGQVADVNLKTTLNSWLGNQGLTLKGGEIQFTNKSKVRSAADVNALQEVIDLHALDEVGNFKASMGVDEFLNFRDDLTDLSKFDSTRKGTQLMGAAKDLRKGLNNNLRGAFEGLAELDARYAENVKALNSVKDLIYKKDGSLKNNAISNVNNLLNKGKEFQRQAIRELFPDEASYRLFEDDIRAIKAVEDISFAGQQKVGNYTRAILEGGGAVLAASSGNIPLAIALVLSHPSIASRFLRIYGKAKAGLSETQVTQMADKIKEGTKLSAQEAVLFQGLIESISDEEAYEAMLELQEEIESPQQ